MKNLRNYIIATIGVFAFISCEKEEAVVQTTDETLTRNQVGPGIAGSLAQFAILGDYLYTIDHSSLNVFDITDGINPVLMETVDLGSGIETIFPRNNYLFIGGELGVKIYDVSNPILPMEVSEFDHARSCDPVVANDKFAFSTLRGGSHCGGIVNEMDIVRITDITNPKLCRIRDLQNPYGLSLSATDDNTIFVCDGWAGLKVFDLYNLPHPDRPLNTDPLEMINRIHGGYEALDVISTVDKELIVLTRQGIFMYDATDRLDLIEKSLISIN
jgi:hypothetical protein